MDELFEHVLPFRQTFQLSDLIGKPVLSNSGIVIGRVIQLRLGHDANHVEGLVVRRGVGTRLLYIGRTYFERISPDAVVLRIDPVVLLVGRDVLSHDGKLLGKVKNVYRVNNTNTIDHLMVRAGLRHPFKVAHSHIKAVGASILLNSTFHAPPNSIWSRRTR